MNPESNLEELEESENFNILKLLVPEEILFMNYELPMRQNRKEKYVSEIIIENGSDELGVTNDITDPRQINNIQKESKPKGRKRNIDKILQITQIKTHDKFSADNVFKKLQTHFFSFIADFHNVIFYKLGLFEDKEKLIKISYKYINGMKIKNFSIYLKMSVGAILKEDTNHHYKNKNNKLILEKLENIEIAKELLSKTYKYLFKNIYYKNRRTVNLGKYGIIELPKDKVEMYEDFIEKNGENEAYAQRIDEYIKKKFFKIFLKNFNY